MQSVRAPSGPLRHSGVSDILQEWHLPWNAVRWWTKEELVSLLQEQFSFVIYLAFPLPKGFQIVAIYLLSLHDKRFILEAKKDKELAFDKQRT